MDVFFETQRDSTFCIELGYWDTVLEIKQKIEKYQSIPVSKQTLFFQGKVLQDHLDIEQCAILHNSCLQLHSSSPGNDQSRNTQVLKTDQSPPSNSTGQIIDGQDLPVMMMARSHNNNKNTKKLRVMVLPKSGTRKIPVKVNAGDNVGELRKELVKMQQRFHELTLPQDGYFFIYKQNVMEDDRSFRWHRVDHGDTIEIFNGSVSGGS